MENISINKKRRKFDESLKTKLLKMIKFGRSISDVLLTTKHSLCSKNNQL